MTGLWKETGSYKYRVTVYSNNFCLCTNSSSLVWRAFEVSKYWQLVLAKLNLIVHAKVWKNVDLEWTVIST